MTFRISCERRPGGWRMLLLAACILGAGAPPAWAQGRGKMYWTDSNNAGSATAKVFRAGMDGSSVQPLVTPGELNARYLALDITAGKMYWADVGTIRRANFDGSAVEDVITGLSAPIGVALDLPRDAIYWTDAVTNTIHRADLPSGTGVVALVTGLNDPRGIELDLTGNKIYWTEATGGKVRRANLDGTGVEDLVTGLTFGQGIALDVPAGKMYFIDSGDIKRADLAGTSLETLVTGLFNTIGIALDPPDNKMYFTQSAGAPGSGRVRRASTDGSGLEDLVTGLDTPWGIALIRAPRGRP
ncbi:MAG: hypothetical protein L0387_39335 [Acidobacteria bacterium]|nr:hypothetical protein [Acidobacteriota bacterium]